MIFNLVKKDMLIVRKFVIIMFFVAFFAPSLLLQNMDVENSMNNTYGVLVFFMVLFVIILLLSSSVSLIDETYKKGCAYLCTTPYTRNQIVLSKYIFSYIIFIAYCLIYIIENMVYPQYTIKLNFEIIIISLLAISIFRGVLIPLEYKFGYEKAKYIIILLPILLPYVLSIVFDKVDISRLDITQIYDMNIGLKMIFVFSVFLINAVSMIVSCYIFKNKEL